MDELWLEQDEDEDEVAEEAEEDGLYMLWVVLAAARRR